MRSVTVLAWACGLSGGIGFALMFDTLAFVMAICLVAGSDPYGKANGKAKLWLELAAFLIAFFVSCSATQQNQYRGY